MPNVQGRNGAAATGAQSAPAESKSMQQFFDLFGTKAHATPEGAHLAEGDVRSLLDQLAALPQSDRDKLKHMGAEGTKDFLCTAGEKDARPAVRQSAKEWFQSLRSGLALPSLS